MKEVQKPFAQEGATHSKPFHSTTGNFYNPATGIQKGQGVHKRSVEEEPNQRPQTAGAMHNTIVLNEKATKQLLTGTDFQLQINQGMLLDILLKELIAIKTGQPQTQSKDAGALRVVLENPESLMAFMAPNVSPVHKDDDKHHGKLQRKGSSNIIANESLKDSIFQQSLQSKKPEPAKRKGLASISEDQESKAFHDEFESVKDEHMFSLSMSHQAKDHGGRHSPGGSKLQTHRNANANGASKAQNTRPFDEGSSF